MGVNLIDSGRFKGIRFHQIVYSGLGGQWAVAIALAHFFSTIGAQVSFTFFGIEKLNPEYKKACQKNNWDYGFIEKKRGIDLGCYRKISSLIREVTPHVILAHSTNLILLLLVSKSFFKLPMIFVEHTAVGVKSKSEQFYSLLVVLFSKQVVLLKKRMQGWIGATNKLRSKEVCTVIPNGIDTKYYQPRLGLLKKNEITLGMAGRFTKSKGQLQLIKSIEYALQNAGDLRYKLLLAGEGNELHKCRSYVNKRNIEWVEFLGRVESSEMVDFYNSLDAYVHHTEFENMSTSILQAMACGKPLMVSANTGSEFLEGFDKSDIFWFENDQQKSFQRQFSALINRVILLNGYSENNRVIVQESFSAEKVSQRYAQLFIDLGLV